MRLILSGRNRFVLLLGPWALKVPSLRCWRDFLFGLLNNLNETAFSRDGSVPCACPVLWCAPGGFLLVMPRARPLTEAEYITHSPPRAPGVEAKPDSFAWLGDRIVAVDYGWRA